MRDESFVKKTVMNIYLIKNAINVRLDILKQKMINVYLACQKNMEDPIVISVNMN